ncbi:MAG: polyphosphate kinase 2 family protein [Candidatus Krumholzibacteriia bacterium]
MTMTTPKQLRKLLAPYRVTDGREFRLADHNPTPDDDLDGLDKAKAQDLLADGVDWLTEAQSRLYAQDRWSVLLIFQAMDAAGKDGTIKHVMSGVNPQGVHVVSFKAPSAEELDHDFMWRSLKNLPGRGRIGIFNRSWYEEVLVVRVHEELLAKQKLPPQLVTKRIWTERCEDITAIERYLARNGTLILKFFLNLSRDEQKERFLARLDDPQKHWKFSAADVRERGHWDAYMEAYEDMVRRTATEHAPWHVVPADRKWFARLVVAAAVVDALAGLDLHYPEVDAEQKQELEEAAKELRDAED